MLALVLLVPGVSAGARVPRNPAEYVALLLFAATGFTLMAAAQQLLVVFLALELASLTLYVLTGFDLSRRESAEAALKYFLFGGMSAAFLLFGFSLIYGLTGSIELPQIATVLAHQPSSPLLAVALTMILVAFGFKLARAFQHLWAPDVYEGALWRRSRRAHRLGVQAQRVRAIHPSALPGFGSAGGKLAAELGADRRAAGRRGDDARKSGRARADERPAAAGVFGHRHAGSLLLGVITVGTGAGSGAGAHYAPPMDSRPSELLE